MIGDFSSKRILLYAYLIKIEIFWSINVFLINEPSNRCLEKLVLIQKLLGKFKSSDIYNILFS